MNVGLSVDGVVQPDELALWNYRTIVLLGPSPGFWPVFEASREACDEQPDPMDRWSSRVVSRIAKEFEADPLFPFGGPPYQPFPQWALASGRSWVSPVGLLVHDRTGLMVSFRGALGFPVVISAQDLPGVDAPLSGKPCDRCADRPCLTACPVGALTEAGYAVPDCKSYLRSTPGKGCMARGCAVRRACPLSLGAKRSDAQSSFHMRAFL